MDDSVKMILKKLNDIDSRLQNLEGTGAAIPASPSPTPTKKVERDSLFPKAVEFMDKFDEISAKQLSENLKIDLKRAESIMDQLESAGFGTCYTKEV